MKYFSIANAVPAEEIAVPTIHAITRLSIACMSFRSEPTSSFTSALVARYGKEEAPEKVIAKISQETLAEMIGTTRSRVSFFMNKFRKLGYIKYNGGLQINSSLLRVVLRDK